SQAREYHYGALDNPALLACEDLQWSGQRDAASNCYRQLSANLQEAPQIRAEALWALGDLQTANSLFQRAVESSPEDPQVRLRWGELYLQTYQYQDALDLF